MPDSPRRRFRFSLRSLILLVALAGSLYGLWMRRHSWSMMTLQAHGRPHHPRLTRDDSKVIAAILGKATKYAVWDVETGRLIQEARPLSVALHDEYFRPPSWALFPQFSGGPSLEFNFRRGGYTHGVQSSDLSPDGRLAVTAGVGRPLHIWRRRRPHTWYGIAWLPELWLMLAVGTWAFRSVRRDNLGLAGVPHSETE